MSRFVCLFLALFSSVGIGQGLSRVRALKQLSQYEFHTNMGTPDLAAECTNHQESAASNIPALSLLGESTSAGPQTLLRQLGQVLFLRVHIDHNCIPRRSYADDRRRKSYAYFASARARRQGPRVLTTAEGSAKL
jgi:hypothetical protein